MKLIDKLTELKGTVDDALAETEALLAAGEHQITQVYRGLQQAAKDIDSRIAQIESHIGEFGEPKPARGEQRVTEFLIPGAASRAEVEWARNNALEVLKNNKGRKDAKEVVGICDKWLEEHPAPAAPGSGEAKELAVALAKDERGQVTAESVRVQRERASAVLVVSPDHKHSLAIVAACDAWEDEQAENARLAAELAAAALRVLAEKEAAEAAAKAAGTGTQTTTQAAAALASATAQAPADKPAASTADVLGAANAGKGKAKK